jgi:membrane-bound lytic murein transglycosylase B
MMDSRLWQKHPAISLWRGWSFLLTASLSACSAYDVQAQKTLAPEVETFIEQMAQKHRFETVALRRLFAQVQPRPDVIRQITAPLTALPWHEFRMRYLTESRINGGVQFWQEHAALLARATREFGVPEEIIVATIGIESIYGRTTGGVNVLEALAMLAFNYPPRAALFRSELEEYLLLAREAGFDVLRTRGSYAGALGIPQFMPSSYRRYARDFDGDGRRDLVNSTADAIGSVANYYKTFGWRPGAAIAVPTEVDPARAGALLEMGIKPQLKISELKRRGVTPAAAVDEEAQAALLVVEAESGPRYWLGLNNFHVITRYNRSVNYALAVHELAKELRALVKPGS